MFKDPEEARKREGAAYDAAEEELALLDEIGAGIDMPSFLAGESSPVLFGAALPNFGVRRLLDAMCDLAPAPKPRADVDGDERPVEAPFSGLVFKVQANMDPAHRDRVAFVRVCSGRFERGMVLTHAATGRPFATKYAQAMFGQERETVETAFPGDVIGLVNATALRPGDTLYADAPVQYPPIPSFAPEHFGVVRCRDAGKYKQFRRGIDQLDTEGVVQVLSSDLRGDQAPVLAAVGPLQFDVVLHRLEHEFGAQVRALAPGLPDRPADRRGRHRGAQGRARRRGADPAARRGAARPVRRQVAAQRHPAGQPVAAPRPAARGHRRVARTGAGYFMRARSIWSKSPTPLVTPPPPDHCHIRAYLLDEVSPPKNWAHVDVPCRHQPVGAADRCEVSGQ